MPKQEIFYQQHTGGRRITVLKTYDQVYARECFDKLDEASRRHLWSALGIEKNYERNEIPLFEDPASEDFLWEEVLDSAREDGNQLSFFVVSESDGGGSRDLYVSPDWPSAQSFAEGRAAQ